MSKLPKISENEVTPKQIYLRRREFMAMAAAGSLSPAVLAEQPWLRDYLQSNELETTLKAKDEITPQDIATTYNNFYEFGTGKTDPAKRAKDFDTTDWKVEIAGHCAKPGVYNLEDLIDFNALEERIYRLRCVEAWSMVIPWLGVELGSLLKRFEPNSKAKYVAFTTLFDPKQMPGQRSGASFIDYPYVEGLRIDEAMHPLTMLAVGMYGEVLPNQNGAPIRLVVPWKYGFKSIKSIVKIEFTEAEPPTTWNQSAPREYGFYANVNPEVSHPRWSQAKETRLPSTLFAPNRIDTLMFNGYGEQVAELYSGMDLRKSF
jgi:sulfoxide reductase catalytic subunit YedY